MTHDLGPLRALALEHGDVDLFPEPVLRLHDQGDRSGALRVLRQAALLEGDPTRRALQLRYTDELLLWADPVKNVPPLMTLNGFGVRIYAGPTRPGGVRLGVWWITALFVPVMPIGAYLVTATADGWRFHGRVPIPRWTWAVPGGIAAAIAAAVLPSAWYASTHADLVAYNGFDVPVDVTVGAEEATVEPHGHHLFAGLPLAETEVAAVAPDGRVFETATVDLTGHSRDLAVYNVAGRGILAVDWVRYSTSGNQEGPEGKILGPVNLQFVDAPDHVFAEPPDSKDLPSHTSYLDESVLHGVDLVADPIAAHDLLAENEMVEHAQAVLDAERVLHPTDPRLMWAAAAHRARFLPEALGTWLRQLRDGAPDSVDAHRVYQVFAPIDRAALVAEYDALVVQNPGSSLLGALACRAREITAETGACYTAVLATDPTCVLALLGLAEWKARSTDYAGAESAFAQLAEAGGTPEDDDPLRLARVLGHPDTAPPVHDPDSILTLDDMLRAERSVGEVDDVVQQVLARDPTLSEGQQHWLESELRLIAGQVPRTRELVRGVPEADLVAMRLALSDGATDDDRQDAIGRLLAPDEGPDWMRVLAWTLVVRADRAHRAAWDAALAGTGPGVVFPAVLDHPEQMRDPARIDTLLAYRVTLQERGAVYAALAVLVDGAAGREYRRRARGILLPQEGPWFQP